MLKPIIAVTSVVLGGATAGLALYIQDNPGAFANTRASPELQQPELRRTVAAARPTEPVALPAPEPVVLEEVTIRNLPPANARTQRERPAAAAGQLVPCSSWRELGPNSGVRQLCQPESAAP
jgi:hypothetical protein